MTSLLATLHDFIDGIVFGNGWLALGALGVVVTVTVLVRLLPAVRV